MSNKFKLLETNAQLELKNGIYQDSGEIFRDSELTNYIQVAVAKVFDEVNDKSLFSLAIESRANTDELRLALSLGQFRFLQTLDLSKVNSVLDISEDFGGVAHFLADQVGSLESVKIDPDRARLSTIRCANKHNVCHISEDLDKLLLPNEHYDLIVLGQLEKLCLNTDQQNALFIKLQAALSSRGTLLINALNSERMSKWFDADSAVGHGGLAFADLYQSTDDNTHLVEQSRKYLRDALLNANFSAIDIHSSFTQGVACKALFSEDYLTNNVNALNHFYRLGSISNPKINEFLLYQRLRSVKTNLVDCADRFVAIAGASKQYTRQLYDNDFSHFPGSGRKPQWRTLTTRKRSSPQVNKRAAYPAVESNSQLVSQHLEPQLFHKGPTLVGDWLQALLDDKHDKFRELVNEYRDWLIELSESDDFTKIAYDLLPFNLLINERGGRSFETIDIEWQINTDFTPDFVLFRALFWFAFENKSLLQVYAENNDIYSLGMFIVQTMPEVTRVDELESFVQLEERIQAQIDNQFRASSVRNALHHTFDNAAQSLETAPQMTVVWGDQNGKMNEEYACAVSWRKETTAQTLHITLPAYDSELPVLRIDPMACTGGFKLDNLKILGADNAPIWSLDAIKEDDRNLSFNGMLKNNDHFLAINQDPHLLIDFTTTPEIGQASTLVVNIAWLWGENHSASLDTLSQALSNQNAGIMAQSNRLNEYRATIKYQTQRIADILNHRADLTEMLKKEERRLKQKQAEITHLNHRLNAQHLRNDELHGYLLMRPTTRAKRVARRTIDRLAGKPIADLPPSETPSTETQPSALPSGELLGQNTEDYGLWVSENDLSDAQIEDAKTAIEDMKIKPVFSILVPIYNTDPEYLLAMIDSVRAQIYPHWQLCLVDDCSPKSYLQQILKHEALQDERICVKLNSVNQGISITTNDALEMATGDYIALLDHDDEISIDALYENARVINTTPDVGVIYSDEDKIDMQGNRLEPYFKPDFSPDLLHTNNYICHFTVIKKSLAEEIGGFREGLDGSQDHDIILRATAAADRVIHIPRILYHWRKIPGSTAVAYDSKSYAWEAGRKAVEDLLSKQEDGVRVEFGSLKGTYRVFREIQGEPLISIIIPFKDRPDLLDNCLNSILNRSSYVNFEIIGVSNNSDEPRTVERMRFFEHADERVRFIEKNIPFNFSAICNYGVEHAKGEYVLLLNNDIEVISPDWIERLLEHAQRPQIGAVGGKLLYPDGRIQHAGVVAGMVGAAGHPHKFFPDNHIGYHGRLHMVYNVSAVTGAMMMMRTDKFKEVGGLDEQHLAVAYNDIDLCLKLLDNGYFNVFTPHCKATHHESISRGYEDTDEKMQRLLTEQSHFLSKWSDFLEDGDPYYNPNLSLKNERFSLRFKD